MSMSINKILMLKCYGTIKIQSNSELLWLYILLRSCSNWSNSTNWYNSQLLPWVRILVKNEAKTQLNDDKSGIVRIHGYVII